MRNHVSGHIVLTSHPHSVYKNSPLLNWGAKTPKERGPVIGSLTNPSQRNAIGTHGGSYSVFAALAIAAKQLKPLHRPDLTNTAPVTNLGPYESWFNPEKMVSIDPWGASVASVFSDELKAGMDIRPTIAVTKAHIRMPEVVNAIERGRLKIDGKVVKENGDVVVTKAAIEPVWYLPGVAKRIGVDEGELRRALFQDTGGMFPELITRPDIKILLPPIGSISVYMFGDPTTISDPTKHLSCRVHDECNGSDVFGSDICTCRPYLVHGIEEAVQSAQNGGNGLIVYFRKEGRGLGEVTKFLVYNARKRQEGGDSAATYFLRTECVAGVEDMRFQELMPDTLHYLGVKRIDRLISMSDMKYNAIVKSGIEVKERVDIPPELIPQDAMVEMEAKKAAGYNTSGQVKVGDDLKKVKGRALDE